MQGCNIVNYCTNTGVTDVIPAPHSMTIIPNPAKDKVTINYPEFENGSISLKLFDLFGRETHFNLTVTNNAQITLDISALSPGVYMYCLTYEKTGERWNGKIVVAE